MLKTQTQARTVTDIRRKVHDRNGVKSLFQCDQNSQSFLKEKKIKHFLKPILTLIKKVLTNHLDQPLNSGPYQNPPCKRLVKTDA